MPATYTFFYQVTLVSGSTYEIVQGFNINATVTDGGGTAGSGDNDEILEVGEDVVANGLVVGAYIGNVGGTSPVYADGGGDFFFYSNTFFQPGSSVTVNTGDPTTVCFAAGTQISTTTGDVRVEDLTIGSLVMTADGRAVPVKWIGRQTVGKLFAGDRARPVRVAAGALGAGLPHSDLVLTADHALILDGLAINSGVLVNGTTITLDPLSSLPAEVTYYHVETEDHDVILANGAQVETYVDYVQRGIFDNYQEYVDLYGDQRTIPEMLLPRITSIFMIPPGLRARFAGEVAV